MTPTNARRGSFLKADIFLAVVGILLEVARVMLGIFMVASLGVAAEVGTTHLFFAQVYLQGHKRMASLAFQP